MGPRGSQPIRTSLISQFLVLFGFGCPLFAGTRHQLPWAQIRSFSGLSESFLLLSFAPLFFLTDLFPSFLLLFGHSFLDNYLSRVFLATAPFSPGSLSHRSFHLTTFDFNDGRPPLRPLLPPRHREQRSKIKRQYTVSLEAGTLDRQTKQSDARKEPCRTTRTARKQTTSSFPLSLRRSLLFPCIRTRTLHFLFPLAPSLHSHSPFFSLHLSSSSYSALSPCF